MLSWDDYDRFRKVPAGIDPAWSEHIGKPLTAVPAPPGSDHPNWAEHFKAPMIEALAELGVEYRGISQTEQYTSGAYREQILLAMRSGGRSTRSSTGTAPRTGRPRRWPTRWTRRTGRRSEAAEGSGAADRGRRRDRRRLLPLQALLLGANATSTTVTAYDDETTEMSYTCACGHAETVRLSEFDRGKLVWKVDWPMRWAFEGVVFEPSGVDHSSPGSSFVVGGQIVREVFGAEQPIGPMYAFVGISGMAKMSSSKGGVPTPADALQIMEAPLLRWLYARRRPNQSFKIAFDQEIQRLYDEWDALARRVADGTAAARPTSPPYDRAHGTAAGPLPATPRPLPYRTLASIVDVTTGDEAQMLRILRDLDPAEPVDSLDEVRPRLDRAAAWVTTQVPAEQRTQVRAEPDAEALGRARQPRAGGAAAAARRAWTSTGRSTGSPRWSTACPRGRPGLAPDAKPTPELKVAQRTFFALLYKLLVGRDTGPRLPTLLLAVGADRVRKLLTA